MIKVPIKIKKIEKKNPHYTFKDFRLCKSDTFRSSFSNLFELKAILKAFLPNLFSFLNFYLKYIFNLKNYLFKILHNKYKNISKIYKIPKISYF